MSMLSNYIDRHSKSQNKATDQKTHTKTSFEISKAYSCARMFNSREKVDANLKRLQTFQANSLRFDQKIQYENTGLNDHSKCEEN